jgi:hypothetical protein
MVLWLESVYLLVLCLVAIGMLILYVNLEEGARVYKRISLSAFLLFFTHILVTRGTPYLITNISGYDAMHHCVYNSQTADFWQADLGDAPDCADLGINYFTESFSKSIFIYLFPPGEMTAVPVSSIPIPGSPFFR